MGAVTGDAGTTLTLQFFANESCDASGYGEGQRSIGTTDVLLDGTGNGSFDAALPAAAGAGDMVTATATAANGRTSEFSACKEAINTPVGSGVVVDPVDDSTGEAPVTLTFDDITGGGNTTLDISDTGPPGPGTFDIGDPATYYQISTTASYTGNIEICIHYDEADIPGDEADLAILHFDTSLDPDAWVEVTTSLNTTTNVICGITTGLSPFVLAVPDGGTGADDVSVPTRYVLYQNVPNPFNPNTSIQYNIIEDVRVNLAIYDVAGRLVRTLVDKNQRASLYQVTWDGVDNAGQTVATGIYFYRLTAGNFVETRKMLLLK